MPSVRETKTPGRPTSGVRPLLPDATSGRELVLLVHRQMRVLAGGHPDLDDLTQTALEQILGAHFRGDSKWSTFTHSVCYRVWLKHLRFTYRFRERFSSFEETEATCVDESPSAESTLHARERYRRLYAALDQVSKKRRAVVALHDIAGLDIAEIGEVVGAKEATVRSRLRDGRKKLAELLKNDDYFGPTFEWSPP